MHPILLKFGPITIYSYGLFVALAFFTASLLVIKDSPKYGIPRDKTWDLLFYILISGIIGGRLLHVALNLAFYKDAPLEILMLHKGGLAIQGGTLAATLAASVFLLKKRLSFWKTGDLAMQYLPLGQAIGRIGCFFNCCCYGKGGHPTQLYSSAALFMIFIILRYISKQKRRFDGEIFILYFFIYCPFRFFMDFLRADLSPSIFGLTYSQIISLTFFIAALFILYEKIHPKGRRGR